MAIRRKAFLGAAAGGTVVLLLQACGGGGSSSDNGSMQAPQALGCGASGGAIAGNHGHVLVIPSADLDSATAMTYDITGSANHAHLVTFSPAQLLMLKAGQAVMVVSTTTLAHDHVVTASCA